MSKKTVIAKVIDIREKTSSRGTFWVVDFEGPDGLDSAYLWSKTVRQQLEEGGSSPVALTIEMRGKWPRITGAETVPVANQTTGMEETSQLDHRDEFIARGVAMKAAAQVLAGSGASACQVMEMASKLLAWLRDPEKALGEEILSQALKRQSDA